MSDPYQRGKIVYPLDEVLQLCLLAVLGGVKTFVDIARFGDNPLVLTSAVQQVCALYRKIGAARRSNGSKIDHLD